MTDTKKFYIYIWFYKDTNRVFYIGKGSGNRYRDVSKRNKRFKEIYNNNPNNCEVKIIEYYDDENLAFEREEELIAEYWAKDEAKANIDKGGFGGYRAQWTQQMKDYFSEYNPMYEEKNKMLIHVNNPMHNQQSLEKYQWSRGHNIVIDEVMYPSVYEAARKLGKAPGTIFLWGQRGYDNNKKPCYYLDPDIDKEAKSKRQIKPRYNAKQIIIDGVLYPSIQAGATAIQGRVECLSKALAAGRKYKGHTCSYANQQPNQENNQ